jgi:hypothetical protein
MQVSLCWKMLVSALAPREVMLTGLQGRILVHDRSVPVIARYGL